MTADIDPSNLFVASMSLDISITGVLGSRDLISGLLGKLREYGQ